MQGEDMRGGSKDERLHSMVIPPSTDRQENSNAFGRSRDAGILWLLQDHPATARMLVEIGYFGSRVRARKRLHCLVERKQLYEAGTISLKIGRPETVYCRRRQQVKADNLRHEVQISRLCFRIHADEVRRGERNVDRYLRPDAELFINGRRFLFEYDAGTMSYESVMEKRFTKYRSCSDLVLWVCSTEARMEGLRKRAAMIRGIALFTTFDQALINPHAPIWMDVDGERAALPRRAKGGANGESEKRVTG